MFLAQLKNELWKLFGKKRTYIGFGAFVLAQTVMLLMFKYTRWQGQFERLLAGNGYLASEYISALTVAVIMLVPQILLLMPLYVTLTGGDLVAKEAEDGTLRLILCRPISRFRLLLVKWTAGMIFSTLLVLALAITALGVASLMFPWKGLFVFVPGQAFGVFSAHEGLLRFAGCQIFLAVNASVILSLAFLFSCCNMKPATATVLALTILLFSLVLENVQVFADYENWFLTHHFKCWLLAFQSPVPWSQIIQSELILAAVATTAFAAGFAIFQLRDIKS